MTICSRTANLSGKTTLMNCLNVSVRFVQANAVPTKKNADVFEQCSYDYDKKSETTKAFYSFVQNKLHFAVTGKTAAELIYERADSQQPTMGLTSWSAAPDGKILKRDVTIAKNYLNKKELRDSTA